MNPILIVNEYSLLEIYDMNVSEAVWSFIWKKMKTNVHSLFTFKDLQFNIATLDVQLISDWGYEFWGKYFLWCPIFILMFEFYFQKINLYCVYIKLLQNNYFVILVSNKFLGMHI